MSERYCPFDAARVAALREALAERPRSLEAFARLRERVSGRAVHVTALRALAAAEPGLAARLFDRVIPSVLRHAQTLVHGAQPPTLPLHATGVAARASLPRGAVAGWVAHMLLGTLRRPGEAWNGLNFHHLLASEYPWELAKLRCVLEYFDRIAERAPRGCIEVERLVAPPPSTLEWLGEGAALTPFAVDETGAIEDADGHRQVDFANAYLGGGVLRGGCVQEEIRFAVAPEHLAAMIISPRMAADEAIVMRGAERFAAVRGYARSLAFAGSCRDGSPRADDGTVDVEFVAIDAVDYRWADPARQFTEAEMLRELGKARAGFRRDGRGLPLATGNWGCGAFGGDHATKAILQWIAASAEGRSLRYCTFGDAKVGPLADFVARARDRCATAGALWARLRAAAAAGGGAGLYARVLGDSA
jgi:poly(ADP-ribose) glycohydrolase